MNGRWLVLGAVVILLAAVPWFGNAVLIQFGINALLIAVLAQSWNILGGFAGYVSFGNSVFYGLGSYGVAIAMAQWNLPFWAGLIFAAAIAVAFAALLGWPILRLRGPYFAIVTLGISAAMSALASNLDIAGKNVGLILPLTGRCTCTWSTAPQRRTKGLPVIVSPRMRAQERRRSAMRSTSSRLNSVRPITVFSLSRTSSSNFLGST